MTECVMLREDASLGSPPTNTKKATIVIAYVIMYLWSDMQLLATFATKGDHDRVRHAKGRRVTRLTSHQYQESNHCDRICDHAPMVGYAITGNICHQRGP